MWSPKRWFDFALKKSQNLTNKYNFSLTVQNLENKITERESKIQKNGRLPAIGFLAGASFCFGCIDFISCWRCGVDHWVSFESNFFLQSCFFWSYRYSESKIIIKIVFVNNGRTVLSCLCPCCICCAALANFAVDLVKLPVKILRWFIHQIPC